MSVRANEHIQSIVKTINSISAKFGGEKVYRDWCEMYALSIANGCDLLKSSLWQKRENRYLDIIKPYKDDGCVDALVQMCAELVMAFEADPFQDHLGTIYMQLFGGNKHLGQCFTPIDVCYVCASTSLEPPNENAQYPITVNDCAVGGGAMLIAACKRYQEMGVDWQRKVKFYANDLDSLCVHMCYIQLSLLGCRGIIRQQNTITQEIFDTFITPMEILWPATLFVEESPKTEPKETPDYNLTVGESSASVEVVSIESLIEG